jgi:CheY-like chemotaxis protein
MPGMTGLELHESLLASGSDIPTVLITAYADETDAHARAQGRHRLLPSQARSARGALRVRPLRAGDPARTAQP